MIILISKVEIFSLDPRKRTKRKVVFKLGPNIDISSIIDIIDTKEVPTVCLESLNSV